LASKKVESFMSVELKWVMWCTVYAFIHTFRSPPPPPRAKLLFSLTKKNQNP